MARYVQGKITEIQKVGSDLQKGEVELSRTIEKSSGRNSNPPQTRPFISYRSLVGTLRKEDTVLLNTIALDRSLGTGGNDIVVANLSRPTKRDNSTGHIIKLRYTPMQTGFSCLEEDPKYRKVFNTHPQDLDGTPVVVCEVLSQTAPVTAMIRSINANAKIALILTDGAALPIQISDLVRDLKALGLVNFTITCGQAFGGDHECVNVYSALIAAVKVLKADVVVVAVGPGMIGTGTFYGHGAFEQAESLTAASRLKASAIGVLRASMKDKRTRHRGISHHTVAVMEATARENVIWPVPSELPNGFDMDVLIKGASSSNKVGRKPRIRKLILERSVNDIFDELNFAPESMGRTTKDDPVFFELAAAAGRYAAGLLDGENIRSERNKRNSS